MPSETIDSVLQRLERDRARLLRETGRAQDALDVAEVALAFARAELASCEAQIASLQSSRPESRVTASRHDDLSLLPRTDAIVALLESSDRPLTIPEIADLLEEHEQGGEYQVVASTLKYLTDGGRIERPSRGRYAARR